MKKVLLIVLGVLLLSSVKVLGIPAQRGSQRIVQSDGTVITVLKYGDEYFRYTTTTDGYTIAQRNGVYYYCEISPDGTTSISKVKANNPGARSAAERAALGKVTKSNPQFFAGAINTARRQQEAALTKSNNWGGPAITKGKVKSLVLLVNYSDEKFRSATANQDFSNMLNQPGYSFNGATGSARDYFLYNSSGVFDPEFVVYGPFDLPHPGAYYGNNLGGRDSNAQEMIRDACKAAEAAGVDFAQFDNDGDGTVEQLFVFYPGYDETSYKGTEDDIWPHKSTLSPAGSYGGKFVQKYACASELYDNFDLNQMTGIGVFCHEYGHVLGLKDMYDTDGQGSGGNNSMDLGYISVMSRGGSNNFCRTPPSFCGFEREQLGWLAYKEFTAAGEITLKNIGENEVYRMETSTKGEYFTFEFRNQIDGPVWDQSSGGTGGMLILQIDQSQRNIGGIAAVDTWRFNLVNANPNHPCARIIASDPRSSIGFFPGRLNKTSFSGTSSPAAVDWAGELLPRSLTEIRIDGKVMKFRVDNGENLLITALTNDALLKWRDNTPATGWRVAYRKRSESVFSAAVVVTGNQHLLTGLTPDTEYTAKVERTTDGVSYTELATTDFKTNPVARDYYGPKPYSIAIKYEQPANTPIYLRLINFPEAVDLIWKVNDGVVSNPVNLPTGTYKVSCETTVNGKKYKVIRYIQTGL